MSDAQETPVLWNAAVPTTILSGCGLVESPRWHNGQLWFADWTAGEILRLDPNTGVEVVARAPAPPLSFDFAPDGAMFVVASGASHLLRQNSNRDLVPFAAFGAAGAWNEIVIGAEGNIYVNGPQLLLVRADGSVESQANEFQFPNGMAISADGETLVCAESWAKRLTAFDVAADGRLANRRVWADLAGPPDGICFDESDAIWYADVPNACCRRVREGGDVLAEIKLDRGGFACMLGGVGRRTLHITSAKWFGMERMADMAGTGIISSIDVSEPGAGWPFG